jgi:hypothetical protein
LGVVAVFLLFATPYSAGTNQIGNNTIYGLGYFDRMQLLFEGPSFAGIYFSIVVAFAIFEASRRLPTKRWLLNALLQISPWLVMASGSRVARISLGLILMTGLLTRNLRHVTLLMVPSAAIAFLVAFNFQSFPDAVMYSVATIYPGSGLSADDLGRMSIGGRFFADKTRTELLMETVEYFFSSSPLTQWVGNGFGVAGFRGSGFPSPHQQPMDLVIEVGVVGFVTYYLFQLSCLMMLLKTKPADGVEKKSLDYVLAASFLSIAGLSIVYETGTRGIGMVVIALIFAASRRKDRGDPVSSHGA